MRYIFASHHKTGTVLMRSIATAFAKTFSLTRAVEWVSMGRFRPDQLTGCHIPQVVALSNLDAGQLLPILRDCDFRAIEFVRDPVNILLSGYLYHSWSSDVWGMDTGPSILSGLSKEEGLRREAVAESAGTLAEMKSVEEIRANDARFLDIPLEGLEGNYDETMRAIGSHLLGNSDGVEPFVVACRLFNISRWPKLRRRSNRHIASRAAKVELHAIFRKLVDAGDPDALKVLQFRRELGRSWTNHT